MRIVARYDTDPLLQRNPKKKRKILKRRSHPKKRAQKMRRQKESFFGQHSSRRISEKQMKKMVDNPL